MFSHSVCGANNEEVSLHYRDVGSGVAFDFAPVDARAFFGTGHAVRCELFEVSASALVSIAFSHEHGSITITQRGTERGGGGSIHLMLAGVDKVESLIATIARVRDHFAAHPTAT